MSEVQLSRSMKGLTVLVTGAGSGMGRATAQVFAAEGANVAATDLPGPALEQVAADLVGQAQKTVGDRPEFKAETRRLLEKQAKKRKAEAMV